MLFLHKSIDLPTFFQSIKSLFEMRLLYLPLLYKHCFLTLGGSKNVFLLECFLGFALLIVASLLSHKLLFLTDHFLNLGHPTFIFGSLRLFHVVIKSSHPFCLYIFDKAIALLEKSLV